MGGTICGFSMPAPFGRRSALTLAFYSDRLQGQWGISEVRDCILAAQHLSTSLNIIDPSRIFIRGGSAGGYTVLAAISSTPPDTPSEFKWTGAASLYGVSDLRRLAEDTHKFESKYLDGLLGGSYEEIPEVYKERSPISHVDKIDTPLLVSCTLRTSPPPRHWIWRFIMECIDPSGVRRRGCPTIPSRAYCALTGRERQKGQIHTFRRRGTRMEES